MQLFFVLPDMFLKDLFSILPTHSIPLIIVNFTSRESPFLVKISDLFIPKAITFINPHTLWLQVFTHLLFQ